MTITSMSLCENKILWPVIDLAQKDNEPPAPSAGGGDLPPATSDLLAHKYKPESVDGLTCHRAQAHRLREWIREFTSASRNRSYATRPRPRANGTGRSRDFDDSSSMSDASDAPEVARKCVLLTGAPGIGKTSLVYSVAKELKMHVIESHASEKRDFKLFSSLKLANQKGKINPIARMFQVAQQKQQKQQQQQHSNGPEEKQSRGRQAKRKRLKLEQPEEAENSGETKATNGKSASSGVGNQQLSLSGDSSIVLFDDIDVVFEEDGPFLKSLVEFIRESKRPVILTATQSMDYLKDILIHFEHIHLDKLMMEDCVRLVQEVCTAEKSYRKLATLTNCRILARKSNGDLRQCLNRIHFYGERAASETQDDASDIPNVTPDFSRLSDAYLTTTRRGNQETVDDDDEATIIYNAPTNAHSSPLHCYETSSLVDLMDSALNIVDRPTLLERWLGGLPSDRNEESTSGHELGEQIRNSVVELTQSLHAANVMSKGELQKHRRDFELARNRAQDMNQRINLRIKGRVEPPERDFYIDIVPMLGEIIKLEAARKRQCAANKAGARCFSPTTGARGPTSPVTGSGTILSRRTRRVQSYLDTVGVYFEPEEFVMVEDTLLAPSELGPDDSEQRDTKNNDYDDGGGPRGRPSSD